MSDLDHIPSDQDRDRLYLGEGIEFRMMDIVPGLKFDTLAEQGCVVADPPNVGASISDRYGTRFHFDAVDSDGICCSFDSRMIAKIYQAGSAS